jgi:tetratricopeptide (TPR) repeat protein
MAVFRLGRRCCLVLLGVAALVVSLAVVPGPGLVAQYDLYRGHKDLQRFHTDSGLEWLLAAERWAPEDAQTQYLLARALRRTGRYDDAARHLERAAQYGLPAARIQLERRLSLAQTARVRDVEAYLPEMLTSPGEDGEEICAAFVNGFCLSLDFGGASKLLDAWTADYPDSAEPYFRRGNVCYGQSDWEGAVSAYRKCLELDAARTKTRLLLAQCLLNRNDPALAEPCFRQVLRESPDNLAAWMGLGMCLLNLTRTDEARAAFLHVVERAPTDFEARQQLGVLEMHLRRPEVALEWIRPIAEAWPDDPAIAMVMAQGLEQTGLAAEAGKYWEVVRRGEQATARLDKLTHDVRHRPADLALRYEIGTLYLRYRSREDGVNWLNSVLQYDPRHPGAHRALSDYYAKTGESELSEQHRRAAAEPESVVGF